VAQLAGGLNKDLERAAATPAASQAASYAGFFICFGGATDAGDGLIRSATTIRQRLQPSALGFGKVALYLFVAWALQCWLKVCPQVGLELVPDEEVHAARYADGTQPLLPDPASPTVQPFQGASG
jgi:hypothetical protein